MLEKGKSYLVQKKHDGKFTGPILEWECIGVGKTAVKVQNKVSGDNSPWSLSRTSAVDTPFWVLLDNIDGIGNKEYQVLETL